MFGVGRVLATTFRLYGRNLPRFFLLTLIAYVPIVGFGFVLEIDAIRDFMTEHVWRPFMELHPALRYQPPSATWIPHGLLAAAIAVCVVGRLRDERVSIWRGAATAFRRMHWIIVVAFAIRLSTIGVSTVIEIALWDDRMFRGFSLMSWIGYGVVWIVCSTIFLVAIPAVTVERRGPFSALARAWTLARGERIKILAIVLVHYVLVVGIYYGLYFAMINPADGMESLQRRFMIYNFARLAIEVILVPLFAILVAVVFEHLRVAKEGPAENQLQRVFD